MTQRLEFFLFEQRDIDGNWSIADRISSAEQVTSYSGHSYLPLATSRGDIERSQTPEREEVTIVIPASHPLAGLWVPSAPEHPIRVTAWRSEDFSVGASSVTVSSATKIIDRGRITGATHSGSRCEFTLRTPAARLVQSGPKQRYQRMCRWDLYGPGCTVDKSFYIESGFTSVTTDPSPLNYQDYVFSSAFEGIGDNYLGGGTIIITYSGKEYARQIAVHLDTAVAHAPAEAYVRLISPFPFEITHGLPLKAYPGCGHSQQDCATKFDNIANFGGFSRVAKKNPFVREAGGGLVRRLLDTGTITFDATARTLTRSTGSWLTDGLYDGKRIYVEKTASNDGTYITAAVTSGTVLEVMEPVVDETVAAEIYL